MPAQPDEPNRFDQIDTRWSLLRLAHQASVNRGGPPATPWPRSTAEPFAATSAPWYWTPRTPTS